MSADPTAPFDIRDALPERSLALEASAGTGKTWTLTALAVRYLAEAGVELPDLLLVTFTRAATAELRERVRLRIAQTLAAAEVARTDPGWSSADPVLDRVVGDALRRDDGGTELTLRRDRLRQAAQQLDEATISTIHGFCQRMLQHSALEAGVDFDAVLLDDDDELLAEIVDDHIARELRPADPDWVRFLQDGAGIGRDRLTALARVVAGLPSLQLRPDVAADGTPPWRIWQDALERFRTVWEDGGRQQAIELIAGMRDDGAFDNPRQATFSANRAAKEAAKVDAWLAAPHPFPPGKVDPKKPQGDEHYPMAYFTGRALATKLPDGATPPSSPVLDAAAGLVAAAPGSATAFLHRAATYLWDELDVRKRQRTVLTFDDLLRRLADALDQDATRQAVRTAIRQRYQVALIDEFQDTDAVQWRIFSSLFDADERFILIGDPKQAIYAFRGADIHTYVDARDSRPEQRTLTSNHRSDARFVQACNVVFGQPGAFATDDIPYHPIEPRHGDRFHDPRSRAAWRLRYVPRHAGEVTAPKDGLPNLTKGWADRALPDDLAAEVVGLLDAGAQLDDDGETRPLAPHDIAVLVRTNRRAGLAQQALRAAGVPAVIQRGGNVFATEEAEALHRLLAALLRPGYERGAVAAAASVLFARDAASLVAQRDALDPHAAGRPREDDADDDPTTGASARDWDAWIDALSRWSQRWHRDGIQAAVRVALADDGVPARLLATPEGERRLTNVRHLLELLHAAETVEGLTPNRLAEWLQTRRADAADGEQASAETELRLEEDAEAVRVVTVHGSKGLQYPVVLCPDLWDGRIRPDDGLTRFHDPDVADPREATVLDLDVDPVSDGKRRARQLAEDEQRVEQLRLAYVALTRAQHRCIIWWGPFGDASTSALASLLHAPAEASTQGRLAAAQGRVEASDDDVLIADLQRLVERSDGAIEVEVVDALADGAVWEPEPGPDEHLDARRFVRGGVDRTWRRVSFTSLVRPATSPDGTASHDGARDVDADSEPAPVSDDDVGGELGALPDLTAADGAGTADGGAPHDGGAAPDGGPVPLAAFPRGAGPGTFLHDVLERVDLTALDDDVAFDEVLARMERRHGVDEQHRTVVRDGLRAAAATPLGPVAADARLADLARTDRLDELRFELPLGGGHRADRESFTLAGIGELLATSTDPLVAGYADRLRDPTLRGRVRGFLNGSIDLLARLPDGRFLVADYKSNWLGDRTAGRSTVAHYHPDALGEAMVDHHYVLQAMLYLVATHRYLRWRLPGYDVAQHLAGGGYLFLRGMVGPDTPTTTDGQPHGVAALRPEPELVVALSRLLDGSST